MAESFSQMYNDLCMCTVHHIAVTQAVYFQALLFVNQADQPLTTEIRARNNRQEPTNVHRTTLGIPKDEDFEILTSQRASLIKMIVDH